MGIFARNKRPLYRRRGVFNKIPILRVLLVGRSSGIKWYSNLPLNLKHQRSSAVKGFRRRSLLKIITYVAMGIIGGAVLLMVAMYFINQVFKLRSGKDLELYAYIVDRLHVPFLNNSGSSRDDKYQDNKYIKGLEALGIPQASGLVDPFNGIDISKEQQVLLERFYQNNSVYILDFRTTLTSIFTFYKDRLAELGWLLVNEVPIEAGYLTNGLYFVKGEQGLRIYTMTGKDVWFELIDKKDAYDTMKRRKTLIDLQVFAVDISRGKQVPPSTGMRFNIPVGFRLVHEKILGADVSRLVIYDKSDRVFAELFPIMQYKIDGKESLKSALKQYIYQKHNANVKRVTCTKGNTEDLNVSIICEAIIKTDKLNILVLALASVDNRAVVIDFGEYSERKALYARYLKENLAFVDLEQQNTNAGYDSDSRR